MFNDTLEGAVSAALAAVAFLPLDSADRKRYAVLGLEFSEGIDADSPEVAGEQLSGILFELASIAELYDAGAVAVAQ